MLIALILAASAGPAAAPTCQQAQPGYAAGALYDPARSIAPQRLADLPPADQILTVVRREDGCERPVIVRSRIGAAGRPGD